MGVGLRGLPRRRCGSGSFVLCTISGLICDPSGVSRFGRMRRFSTNGAGEIDADLGFG